MFNLPDPVSVRPLVIAKCSKCMGNMREHEDKGAFSKAPFGRLWIYQCDNCGRKVQFCAPTSPIEQAYAKLGEQNMKVN